MSRKTLSVVVPVYYNETSLPLLITALAEVDKQLNERGVELEAIFVDDGSPDRSIDEMKKAKSQLKRVKIIRHARNFGAVSASKTGFRFVEGDCFMSLAADLQDPPELILQMVDRWLAGSKFVICVRESRQDPLSSRMFAALFYRLIRVFVVKGYPPGGYDVGLMDKVMLPHMINSGKNINNALFAYWLGFSPSVISYTRRERIYGKSRWSFRKRVKFFLDSLLGFSMSPLRMISLIGMVVALLSFIYGAILVRHALEGKVPVQGFTTLATLISFFSGLIIIMLGIIGEYIWRIFDEANRRPETVISEILLSTETQ